VGCSNLLATGAVPEGGPRDPELFEHRPQEGDREPGHGVRIALHSRDKWCAQPFESERPGDEQWFARGDVGVDFGVIQIGGKGYGGR
jgi:hypothetical protein